MATQKLQVGRALPLGIYSNDVDIPFPALSISGTATGGSATTLQDTNVTFVQGQINPGDIVWNTTQETADIVTAIISPTEIALAGYGGGFSGVDSYQIYAGGNNSGCVLYIGAGGDLEVQTVGGDNVTFSGVVTGQFIPVNVMKIKTGTTAGNIIALW